jgi:formate hydrogenlyase subunit 3/multisubunit Na+/H+ antiporter MnhD subunit
MTPIDCVFLLPILVVGAAAAVHATAYLHGGGRRFAFFFLATLAAMTAVVFARGKLAFLLAWEAMGLFSAGLVAFEATGKEVRRATWIYLLACHAGACALMLAGVFLHRPDAWAAAFACAVVGFGLKIGFPPFHSWLPEAHPAAPAPASAVLSGAMIPLGFLGFLRFFPLRELAASEAQCFGWTFLLLGLTGALGGILFSLPQTNLKRLLAFSSVENMGIVAMGLGLSALAWGRGAGASVAALCAAGALVHILNHAFLKGALFLTAGSVLRQTGTLDQDCLGGLLRRLPLTGTLFTLNAFALAGLPPFNAFLGELVIYIGAFAAIRTGDPALVTAGFLTVTGLALTGGLAVAAYAKAIGAAFLGEARSAAAATAVETPRRMWMAPLGLTLCSLAMVPGSVFVVQRLTGETLPFLGATAATGGVLAFFTAALVFLRRFVCPRGGERPRLPVWDCGYEAPTPRMAYTATAFTQPLTALFRPLLRPRRHLRPFTGDPSTPTDAAVATETDDAAIALLWRPLFTSAARLFQRAHLLQNGSLHLYILIVLIAVLALLAAALAS